MNIEEKRKKLHEYCAIPGSCSNCGLFGFGKECEFDRFTEEEVERAYKIAFGDECDVFCEDCKYGDVDEDEFPCDKSLNFIRRLNKFEPIEEDITADTVQREEINHPDRYAGGKFECIDVMQDVFGADAVKNFCILNAFKYIWRAEKKNGIEDIKKAVWYLNKYIELGAESNE